jgi:high-affinity nickel permease
MSLFTAMAIQNVATVFAVPSHYSRDHDRASWELLFMGMLFGLGFETAIATAVLTYRVPGSISNSRAGTRLTI